MAVFHDGAAWVAQVGLFLVLGLLITPSRLGSVLSDGIVLALVVLLVARPVATMTMTSPREFTLRERVVLSWAEMLGATPIVFAALAAAGGISGSREIFDLVSVAVVTSTLLQGLTFEPLARALGLTGVAPLLPRPLAEFGGASRLRAEIVEFPVTAADGAVGRTIRELDLPLGITVALIVRDGEAVSPADGERLKAADTLHLLVREEVSARIPELLARLRSSGPEQRRTAWLDTDDASGRLVTEPWTSEHGDPDDPELLAGIPVIERLRGRRDRRGALVVLEDGRYAVTGTTLAVGPADVVRRYAGRRVAGAPDRAEEAWWREVVAALLRPAASR
jgi:cell volume regulation protein A